MSSEEREGFREQAPAGHGGIPSRPALARAPAVARVLDSMSRWSLWGIALFVLVVIPWFFGGMGPEGYWFTVWAGRACLLPLGLWAVSSFLLRRRPPVGFWVAVSCWGLLAAQVWVSLGNPTQVPRPPWLPEGFEPVPFDASLPSTVSLLGTQVQSLLWLSFGLLALTGYSIGTTPRLLRLLMWMVVVNVAVLAALGIPYKYSGSYLMLGRFPMPENYFFSTFTYHNHWCAYALLGLSCAVGLFVAVRSLWGRLLLVVLGAPILISAPLSVSRLGTLLMLAFLALVAVVYFRKERLGRQVFSRRGVVLGLIGLASLLAFAGGAMYLNHKGPGSVGQRSWSYIITQNPFNSRIALVQDAIPMVKAKPLWGWGLGSFGVGFRNYQRPESIVVYNEGRVTRYEHCHNDWMESLVELGGLGAFLCICPFLLWTWQRYHQGFGGPARTWILVGLACLALFALGDMVFVNRSLAGAMSILLPILLSRNGPIE